MPDRIADGIGFAGQPYNPYKFRVSLASTTVNVTSTGQIVPWDTGPVGSTAPNTDAFDFDSVLAFDFTNHQLVVPVAGYWALAMLVSYNLPATRTAPITFFASFYNNGTISIAKLIAPVNAGDANDWWSVGLADVLYLNQGDLLQGFGGQRNAGGTGNITYAAGSRATYFAGHLISV